jgi:hypothetical protein
MLAFMFTALLFVSIPLAAAAAVGESVKHVAIIGQSTYHINAPASGYSETRRWPSSFCNFLLISRLYFLLCHFSSCHFHRQPRLNIRIALPSWRDETNMKCRRGSRRRFSCVLSAQVRSAGRHFCKHHDLRKGRPSWRANVDRQCL